MKLKAAPAALVLLGLVSQPVGAGEPANRVTPVAMSDVTVGATTGQRTYFSAFTASEREMIAFRDELRASGARNVNFFAPDVIVCELPPGLDLATLPGADRVSQQPEIAVAAGRSAPAVDRLSFVRRCYEQVDHARSSAGSVHDHVQPFRDVVRIVDPSVARDIQRRQLASGVSTAAERTIRQNSEFFGGSILAQLVLPESNGSAEPETHDWTDQELATAVSGAVVGLLAVQQAFPRMGISLTFREFKGTPTAYEPIEHNMQDDPIWIVDTLERIGEGLTSDDDLAMAHELNNKGRAKYGTTFAYTAFIAYSENAPDHKFKDADYTAYANLGGPYMVIPYPAGLDPNDIGEWLVFSQIFQHETAHCFFALDEYVIAPSHCTDRSGYLNVQNLNKLTQFPDGTITNCYPDGILDCLMANAAREDIGRPWCRFSQGQIGVVDRNDNSIPDIFESAPVVTFSGAKVETVTTEDITLSITAQSTAVKNINPAQAPAERIDYAAPLGGGAFNLDGTGDVGLLAADGRWDELQEEAVLTIKSLPVGLSTVFAKARNTAGMWSKEASKKIYFVGINYSQFNLYPHQDGIEVSWEVVGETFDAKFDVYRIDPGEQAPGKRIAQDVQPSGPAHNGFLPYRFVDKTAEPGQTYSYYTEGYFTLVIDGEDRDFNNQSHVTEATAMLPLASGGAMSSAAPNPFNGVTRVSFVIPKTFTNGGSPGFQQRVATEVKVAVFDVMGRRVKTLRNSKEFVDGLTVEWDGTDTNNRSVPSGVYFIRVNAGEFSNSRKVLLVR